jgi:hypothetical protein
MYLFRESKSILYWEERRGRKLKLEILSHFLNFILCHFFKDIFPWLENGPDGLHTYVHWVDPNPCYSVVAESLIIIENN